MKIDRAEFQETARVILIVNHHAKENYTVETLVNFLEGMAYKIIQGEGATFCGTMGFYLSAFRDHENEIVVRSTIASWIIDKYLESERKKIERVLDLIT